MVSDHTHVSDHVLGLQRGNGEPVRGVLLPWCPAGVWHAVHHAKVVLELSASGRLQPASAAFTSGGSVTVFARGVSAYSQYSRWGDYPAVAADPTKPGTAWLSGEYARTTGAWGTAVFNVTP